MQGNDYPWGSDVLSTGVQTQGEDQIEIKLNLLILSCYWWKGIILQLVTNKTGKN